MYRMWGEGMNSKSFDKLLKIVHKHKDDKQFQGINMKKAKIRLTDDFEALIKQYHLSVVGDYILFR